MRGRVGHVSQVRASRSCGTYLPYVPYLLPYFYMYILGMWTGDDESLIYWKYIIIPYSREARISN